MARVLSPWCKQLASKVGLTREYTSAIVNGRAFSEPAIKAISDVLNIAETACSLN